MASSNRNNSVLVKFRDWVTGSWGGLSGILITAGIFIFGLGYWIGNYVAKSEAEFTIINLNLAHNKELSDEREKAKIQAAQEVKEKKEDLELLVKRVKEEMSSGKK